jgi:hypothetical protein
VTAGSNSPLRNISSGRIAAKLPEDAPVDHAGFEPVSLAGQAHAPFGRRVWLHRIFILLFVLLCAVVGVLLVILPWRPEWTDNYFLLGSPGLRALVASGFVRGVCSGLGVLNIWIGFWEAVHYHEVKQN